MRRERDRLTPKGTSAAVVPLIGSEHVMSLDPEFEELVNLHYRSLYQFALSLARAEGEAADLTQQTFYIWASKGHQLRDRAKARTWLFTTLHREYLGRRRRVERFPHLDLEQADHELPVVAPPPSTQLDAAVVREALGRLDEAFRAPVALFYLEDVPYQEIAEILGIPIGTVKSRLSRGIAHLQKLLGVGAEPRTVEGGRHG